MSITFDFTFPGQNRRYVTKVPVSVRIEPVIDCALQEVTHDHPGTTQSQVINYLLREGLKNLGYINS